MINSENSENPKKGKKYRIDRQHMFKAYSLS